MLKLLSPDMFVNSILEVPAEKLARENITAYILDLDNTVTEWNSNRLTAETVSWFKGIKELGCRACIVSNNKEARVQAVAEILEIPYVYRAGKPLRRAFYRALEHLKTVPAQTSVIGDQIFTDILGGNLMGMFTILVAPINKREFLGTRVVTRQVEKLVLKSIKSRVLNNSRDTVIRP